MGRKERWGYYMSSFERVEPTEGIDRDHLQKSVLLRNLPASGVEEGSYNSRKALIYEENLGFQVCMNTLKMIWTTGGSEYFIYADKPLTTGAARSRLQKFEDARTQRFREKFVMNANWMKGLDHDQVQKITLDCKKWIDEGILPGSAAPQADAVIDQAML
jgi:paired amphipathic helix protein Sin3a